MLLCRRLLIIQLLMLWQGGFVFYAAVVVPTGTEVLGSAMAQGRITRIVTRVLNGVGVLATAALAWELACVSHAALRSKLLAWGVWSVLAVGLVALFILHTVLSGMIDHDSHQVRHLDRFRLVHGVYLWISTVQWFASVFLIWHLLRCWQQSDRVITPAPSSPPPSSSPDPS